MDLIWAKRETIYFCSNGWTGSISLIGFEKLADWCGGYLRVETMILRALGNG
jgi:hypothetical protein